MKKFTKFLVVLICLALLAGVAGCGGSGSKGEEPKKEGEKIKVGFLLLASRDDGGWSQTHAEAAKYLEEKIPNVEAVIVDNVPESSDAERIMTEMAQDGCKIIFGTTFGFMDYMDNVSKKFPDVTFFHCSGYKTEPNLSTYFGRMYQARYLSGLIAGGMTKSNIIGYVAAHPIPEVIRQINAFTLGVQEVNPNAKVKVVWTNTWYDPAKEKEASLGVIDAGADVVTQHQSTPGTDQGAQERGVYAIGYTTDMTKFAPDAELTAVIWNWGPVYVRLVQSVIDGTYETSQYWGGMEDGVIDLAPISDKVPADIVKLVEQRKAEIIDGSFNVFAGPIIGQDGKELYPEGTTVPDADLLSCNWFIKGVEGVIPQ